MINLYSELFNVNTLIPADGVEIVNIPELGNITLEESTSMNSEGTEFNDQYLDVRQELKFPVIGWLDNKALGCRIEIKDNSSNNALPNLDANDEKLNINVTFYVRGRFSGRSKPI